MQASSDDPTEYLRRLGKAGEGPHDIATAALMLSALDHAGRDLTRYRSHLAEVAERAREDLRLSRNAEDGAHALSMLLVGHYGYDGDRLSYDDPQNADFVGVIERRKGLPVALGILYLHAARAAGFEASGLRAPGHFLLRIGLGKSETLIDPFNGGTAIERETLGSHPATRAVAVEQEDALEPVSDVEVLLRLQNNLKLRALQLGERGRALDIALRMVLVGPRKPELWIDLAGLHEAAGALGAAQKAYEATLALVRPGDPLHNEATLGLHGLKRRLN
jgi:regulator of sirC expression with transglutaminase-like and TPR domain